MMRYYERLDLAFLYEFAVGLLAVYCVYAVGPKGVVAWALMGFRPFLFRIGPGDGWTWRFYNETLKWAFILTGATLVITYLFFGFLPVNYHERIIILFTTLPWFFLIHGLVGLILLWENRQVISRLS